MYLKWMIHEKIETNSKKDPPPQKKGNPRTNKWSFHECGVVPVLNTCDEIYNNQFWED